MSKKIKSGEKRTSAATTSLSVILILFVAAMNGVSAVFFFYRAGGVLAERALLFSVLSCVLIAAVAVSGSVFCILKKEVLYRLALVGEIFLFFVLLVFCVITVTGVKDKISSIEELRDFVSSFGANAVLISLVFQILQVVVLPVPGFVAIGATVALFGPFKGSIISLIGILIGSFTAFFIGRGFGYKTASWLVGEKSLDKALAAVKGKDKAVLTVMFVFPFFPDDVLCFAAGLSTMSTAYFSVMIVIARALAVFGTAYSVNGSIIPYDTWWGILLWALVFVAVGAASYFIYKKGDAIERFFSQKFGKRKPKNEKS